MYRREGQNTVPVLAYLSVLSPRPHRARITSSLQFHTPDDTEFEVSFDGPTGKGIGGKCVGCMPFFEKLGLTKSDMDSLVTYVDAFEKFFRGRESNDGSPEKDRISNLVDRLMELVHKFSVAIQTPE